MGNQNSEAYFKDELFDKKLEVNKFNELVERYSSFYQSDPSNPQNYFELIGTLLPLRNFIEEEGITHICVYPKHSENDKNKIDAEVWDTKRSCTIQVTLGGDDYQQVMLRNKILAKYGHVSPIGRIFPNRELMEKDLLERHPDLIGGNERLIKELPPIEYYIREEYDEYPMDSNPTMYQSKNKAAILGSKELNDYIKFKIQQIKGAIQKKKQGNSKYDILLICIPNFSTFDPEYWYSSVINQTSRLYIKSKDKIYVTLVKEGNVRRIQ